MLTTLLRSSQSWEAVQRLTSRGHAGSTSTLAATTYCDDCRVLTWKWHAHDGEDGAGELA
jgi:hypothetical protein